MDDDTSSKRMEAIEQALVTLRVRVEGQDRLIAVLFARLQAQTPAVAAVEPPAK